MPKDFTEASAVDDEYEGAALRSIDSTHYLFKLNEIEKIIKHNEDLQDKLLKDQEESRFVWTANVLNKCQQELIQNHERCNYTMQEAEIQLLAALNTFYEENIQTHNASLWCMLLWIY